MLDEVTQSENCVFTEFLVKNRKKRFHIVSLPGNHGDILIHQGLFKKLKELDIPFYNTNIKKNRLYYIYRTLHSRFGVTGRITIKNDCDFILFQGGGYMSDFTGLCNGLRLLECVSRYAKPIVFAPQAFYFTNVDFKKILEKAESEIYLFCREKQSFQLLQEMNLPGHIYSFVSPDTAFYFNKSDFNDTNGGYDLVSFRKGGESKLSSLEKETFIKYLEGIGRKIYCEDVSISGTYQDFVQIIAGADRIFTDRLHVAILGSILEKKTILFPNIYFKNKAVYNYSLIEYLETYFFDSIKECMKAMENNKYSNNHKNLLITPRNQLDFIPNL